MLLCALIAMNSCSDKDDDGSNGGNNTTPNGPTIVLTSANYTEDGYFDGMLYYKITSNSPCEVMVAKAEKSAVTVAIPSIVKIDGTNYQCTSIGSDAFYKCSGLTSITIPNSVTSIGARAFANCSGLTSVYISDLAAWCKIKFGEGSANPLSGAQHLYLNGKEIKDLVIPNGVTSIGARAFSGCSGLTSVTIPNSVTSIGDYAFRDCSGLTSVTIGNKVASIGEYAFYGCRGLTSVAIPNSVTSIGDYAFRDCSGLTSVTIGDKVESIDGSAFKGCSRLTSVTIPNSVTSIGSGVFYGCSGLTSVTIGNKVESIGEYAFYACSSLTSVHCKSSTPPLLIYYGHFLVTPEQKTLYVPIGASSAYQASYYWRESFSQIVEE